MPVVLVGAGNMGRHWIRTIESTPEVRLVGIVDLDLDLAARVAQDEALDVAIGSSVSEVAARSGGAAVVNVTVPAAHRPVNEEALFAGLPVLCEKPIAPTLVDALQQAALAEVAGGLLMVSQSRRYFTELVRLRAIADRLGRVGAITTEFYKAPHFGGFRDRMEQPLLVDMAIHQFDMARYLLRADPVSVSCSSWNPAWSWYDGDASAAATFEFDDGARYSFTGSWCAPGRETSWNGAWRISAEHGTAVWDGDGVPEADGIDSLPEAPDGPEEIAGSLAEFVRSLRSGEVPQNEIHENIHSLAMVEAAVLSARTGERVDIAQLLELRYAEAVRTERRTDVRERLEQWGSVARLRLRGAAEVAS
nr:Gfo/Idh/MocA family oxidoreductase [Leifsonia shinshuensis]